MHVMIVYDSKFGNTKAVAQTIGETMRGRANVDVFSTSEVESIPSDLDLLVVGSPTQAHGVEQTMKDFLDAVPTERVRDVRLAVFDTRVKWPKLLSGSAADGIAKRLERKGARLIHEPESFFVGDKEGPLLEDELTRASEWGEHLFAAIP
jgi:flavodoxin